VLIVGAGIAGLGLARALRRRGVIAEVVERLERWPSTWAGLYLPANAVERVFGRLKNEYGLAPLRTRGLDRVRIHADLVMLARLGQALSRARAVPLAA
jgi:2-polyprenyl-6-methoxyphenol hydroxylase-like FAD-dependent oxidoreductase